MHFAYLISVALEVNRLEAALEVALGQLSTDQAAVNTEQAKCDNHLLLVDSVS